MKKLKHIAIIAILAMMGLSSFAKNSRKGKLHKLRVPNPYTTVTFRLSCGVEVYMQVYQIYTGTSELGFNYALNAKANALEKAECSGPDPNDVRYI